VHGLWCGSRTFPLPCRYCAKPIFLFTCNCGSVVLFEELGTPWPKHLCAKAPWADEDEGPTYGLDREYASRIVRAFAQANGLPVPTLRWEEDVSVDLLVARRAAAPAPIVRAAPEANPVRIVGIVREVIADVDPVKKLAVKGPLLERQLAKRVPARVVQLTVVVQPEGEGPHLSYTAWADPRLAGVRDVKKPDLVSLELRPVAIPALEVFWLVSACESLV
jgi:hypothetical protein